ncbi:MAG TPA: carbon monoxide dehydrogenase subunit G [Thermoplasmata archaeon]|nr:carbon monoxide dehydrogenase subunit G [Thermoplasmata archaeon]
MHFEGAYRVRAAPDKVWSVLVDLKRVIGYLPDVQVLELETPDPDTVVGKVKAGVSFIKGTFTIDARIVERDAPRRARLSLRASGMGSTIDVDSSLALTQLGDETEVAWSADAVIRGTIASIGARLLPGIVEKKTQEFFEALRTQALS